MIRENNRWMVVTSLIILLPVLAGVLLWHQLPDQVPVHFNGEGVPDTYKSKLAGVTVVYIGVLICHWVAAWITAVDPRRKNVSTKIFRMVLCICPAVSVFAGIVIYGSALNWHWVKVDFMANLLVGLLFIVIGNYLPKCRQNYTIGIKLPWTLNDEENWDKTHRFAGKIWMVGGIFEILAGFIPALKMEVVTMVILMIIIVPVIVYSYCVYKKKIG